MGHDASRTGAPMILLHLIRWLKANTDASFSILLGDGGPLEAAFRELGPTWILPRELWPNGGNPELLDRVPLVRRWRSQARYARLRQAVGIPRPDVIYVNTVATRPTLEFLEFLDAPVVTHVHELDATIRLHIGMENFEYIKRRSARFIAVSDAVRSNLLDNYAIDAGRVELVHEFIDTGARPSKPREERRRALCEELGIDSRARLVGGVGTLNWRKGPDLFLQVARRVCGDQAGKSVHFLWLGGDLERDPLIQELRTDLQKAGLQGRVHLLGSRPDPINYIDLFDVFILPSREDPYPLVVLEAAAMGKPIVCFEAAGGAPEFVGDDAGFVVPYLDTETMALRVLELLGSESRLSSLGMAARDKVRRQHDVEHASRQIHELILLMRETGRPGTVDRQDL
ncbi:glycosyltransferase family 4 protein (plasmid) [Tundrisphaera lichenicola]|uniref:glycosyltransferase family 4 protein n=1 Tax=Tundrisphaera lichenicola TaxID=2029860 RepID=UPI003EC151EB